MSDISHLIRLFYLDSEDQQWRKDMADRVMAQIALLREEHKDYKRRAEAAEKRAADAEVRAKSWHDSAMTLADQRDAAYKRNTELEAALNDIKANTFMPDGTRLSDAVKQVMQERDELARKLEQAQHEIERLTRFLQTIFNLGDKSHAAFDGERHRQMRHCANQALNTKREFYEP